MICRAVCSSYKSTKGEYAMIEGNVPRKITQKQREEMVQVVAEAIPNLTYGQAKLLCNNKERLYQSVRKAISDTVFDINIEKTVA